MPIPSSFSPTPDLLRDRVIFITGSSDGIGRALAKAVASCGAHVILHGRNLKKLERVYDEIIAAKQPRPSLLPLDLEKAGPQEYEAIAQAIDKEFGHLDGLVHNAAILGERAPIAHYDVAKWLRTMHINVNAPFILTKYCLPLLMKSQDASIIFTSSGIVPNPRAYWGAYLASKWADEGLMRMLAVELDAEPHLRVNSVNPGKVRTNMRLQAYPAENRDLLSAPEDVLKPYLYLLSRASRGVTGQSLASQDPPAFVAH